MYTVIVNDDKSLTTSILEKLIGDNTNTIQFLMRSYASESDSDNEDDQSATPNIQIVYSADLHYKTGGLEKAVRLVTDSSLYKERVRFVLPSYSVFWNHRGVIEYWLDITIETITTTIDESTGLNVVSRSTQYVVTYPTTLLIDGSPFNKCRWKGECNTIFVTRGDSKQIKIVLTDDEGYPYEPEVGDELWFRVKKTAYMDNTDRIEVERKFSLAKRKFGLGLLLTKREDTTKASIVLSIIAMNIDRLAAMLLRFFQFLLYFEMPHGLTEGS